MPVSGPNLRYGGDFLFLKPNTMDAFDKRTSRTLLFAVALALIAGCAHGPYAASKKTYRKQLRAEYKELKRMDPPLLDDSLLQLPAGFIPTVNFNLRKPNFVVIHHTAQNSC